MVKKQKNNESIHMRAARAVDELRRQMGIMIQGHGGKSFIAYPAEYVTKETLAGLPKKNLTLLITAARARSIGLDADSVVAIRAADLPLKTILALVDPTHALPASGSILIDSRFSAKDGEAMVALAKHASLLPAMLIAECKKAPAALAAYSITFADIKTYLKTPETKIIETARAKLPIEHAENATLISLRTLGSASVHLALLVGDVARQKNPLTRIHSSCVTGDILGSLRCDCGDQLQLALQKITAEGAGILIYLHQEGRGIGITNKLRAYALQEQGVDTYEANLMLGFDEDERDFSIAAAILKKLGIKTIRLLTNNPYKLKSLSARGIKISERIPLVTTSGKHSHDYMSAKSKKAGHLL